VFTKCATYPWSFVTQIFYNGKASHGGDRKCSTIPCVPQSIPFYLVSTTCPTIPCVPERVPFYLVSTTCPILPLCPQRVPRYLVSTKYPILPCVHKVSHSTLCPQRVPRYLMDIILLPWGRIHVLPAV
jgi:hypothetical protein